MPKTEEKYIVALDIGTSKVCVLVGEIADRGQLEIIGKGSEKTVGEYSALDRRPIVGGRVMIVSPHHPDYVAIEQVLPDDGLSLTPVPEGRTALEVAANPRGVGHLTGRDGQAVGLPAHPSRARLRLQARGKRTAAACASQVCKIGEGFDGRFD